jgi:GH35 family endo-1,4-beta-xylanase
MRFTVHPAGLLDDHVQKAYVSGFDGRVFPSRVEAKGDTIEFLRVNSDSGKLAIPYPVEGQGWPIVSTATLREHEDTYILSLELARGKICQVRNQLATWEGLGMSIPQDFRKVHREAHSLFAKATTAQPDIEKVCALANQAIARSCTAAELLTQAYVEQRLSVRLKKSPQTSVSFGCAVNSVAAAEEHSDLFCQAFNSAAVPIEWKVIEPQEGEYDWEACDKIVEFCQSNKLLMRAGPLLDLSNDGLPEWLKQWGHDFFNLQSFLCDFVETAISKYQGKVRIWEVSSRINTGGAFNLNEEERLTLVARTLEVARKVDEEAKLFIRIDQPWGAYQTEGNHRLSPIQFVDALLRCGIGLSGVNLEIAVGYTGQDSGPRDLLDFSRLLDQWSMLEIPLHVTLAFPTSSETDAHSENTLSVELAGWRQPWSEDAQTEWINLYVPMLMAKQSVVGVYWSHLTDASKHVFPNAGLVDADGKSKTALEAFMKHRTGRSIH